MALSTDELILKVLRKNFDQLIQGYLFASTFTALYEHDDAVSKWNPLNLEGSLYLTKKLPPLVETKMETGLTNMKLSRSAYEYQLILLNRKEKRDFVETVTADMEFTVNGKYVYLKTPVKEAHRST